MFKALSLAASTAGVLALGIGTAAAVPATLTNGFLTSVVTDVNGAFDTNTLGGTEFFKIDALVADFGMQEVGNAGSFRINTIAGGATGLPLNPGTFTQPTPRSVKYSYTFNPSVGVNVVTTRTVTLLNALNVLRVDIQLQNTGTKTARMQIFDTFDPDQGGSGANATTNDVTSINSPVGIATAPSNGYSVAIGGSGFKVGFGSGTSPFGLGIDSSAELQTFLSTPFDPNGATADIGLSVGRRTDITVGSTTRFRYFIAFGVNEADARQAFKYATQTAAPAVAGASVVTPVPAALPLLAAGLAGLAALRRVRAKRAA
jgi:hypothetical protein